MADTKTTGAPVPADWKPGDCDPELTELVRSAFGSFEAFEGAVPGKDERALAESRSE